MSNCWSVPQYGLLTASPATGMYDYAIKNNFITDEDKYLDPIPERQDLCLNMTKMPDDKVREFIAEGVKS